MKGSRVAIEDKSRMGRKIFVIILTHERMKKLLSSMLQLQEDGSERETEVEDERKGHNL